MFDTLTERVAVVLDDLLGDAVTDVEFGDLVDAVIDDLAARFAALPEAVA